MNHPTLDEVLDRIASHFADAVVDLDFDLASRWFEAGEVASRRAQAEYLDGGP